MCGESPCQNETWCVFQHIPLVKMSLLSSPLVVVSGGGPVVVGFSTEKSMK